MQNASVLLNALLVRKFIFLQIETDDYASSDYSSTCAAEISNEQSSESQSSTNIKVPMEAIEQSSQSNEQQSTSIQRPCSQTFTLHENGRRLTVVLS